MSDSITLRHTDTYSKLLYRGCNIFGNKYRNKHNINQSQTIHITKAEIDMNITQGSVYQSSGLTRSTQSQNNSNMCYTKEYINESISQEYTTKTTNLSSKQKVRVMDPWREVKLKHLQHLGLTRVLFNKKIINGSV